MAPDTPESRLARVEERVDSNRRQIDVFGPLPLAVERVQWSIDAINSRLDKRDREDVERFEKLARSFENQITACSNAVARVAEGQEALAQAERARAQREASREKDEETEEKTKAQKFVARYGLITGLSVVLVSSLTSIGIAVFGGS